MTLPKFEQAILIILGGLSAVALISSSSDKLASKSVQAAAQPATQRMIYKRLDTYAPSFGATLPATLSAPTLDFASRQLGSPIILPVVTPTPQTSAGGLVLHSLARNNQAIFSGQLTITTPPAPLPIIAADTINLDRPRSYLDSARASNSPKPDTPTEIIIPTINLTANIQEVGIIKTKTGSNTWATAKGRAAGWHNDSARLGEHGNIVLNGHNNIDGKVFERLQDLKVGQKVILRSNTREITYVLYDKELLLERGQPASVLMEHAKYLLQTPDDRLTLVTCWPNWDNSHRLLWFARPVEEKIIK